MSGTYNHKDRLHQKAKSEGYRARSAYKLLELDERFKLLRSGAAVIDLGCAPGGWLQVAAEKLGGGKLIGVDLEEIGEVRGATFVHGDFTTPEIQADITKAADGKVDLILSDMSPKLSGIRFRDACFAAELVETAFLFASENLKPGGNFVAKIFPGAESDEVFQKIRKSFAKAQRVNLDSSRKTSTEYYLVAQGFKGN